MGPTTPTPTDMGIEKNISLVHVDDNHPNPIDLLSLPFGPDVQHVGLVFGKYNSPDK